MPHHDHRDPLDRGHHRPDPHRSQPVPPVPPGLRGRPPRRRPRRATCFTAAGAVLAVGASLGAVALSDPAALNLNARTTAGGRTILPAAADTYVVRERPGRGYGTAQKITASLWPDWHTEAYVAFDVPAGTPPFTGARVEMTFDRPENRPRTVSLRALPGSWTEAGTSWRNRPAAGHVVATATDTTRNRIAFDVGSVVKRPGRYAFAIVNDEDWSAASVHSRESGRSGPRLVLGTGKAAAPARTGTRPSPTPTAPDAPGPEPTWSVPSPTPTAGPDGRRTLCGVSLNLRSGETFQQALSRMDGEYGGLETVRLFYRGVPPAWPGNPDVGERPAIISFKLAPRDVLAGEHDAALTRWFTTAPRDRDVYWVYYHEPEDNIADGEFTAADYRAAWRHLRALADKAGNRRLHATLVLMGWSLDPLSRRDWRDYHPGRDVVQALGWDVYNLEHKKGRYQDPAAMYDRVVATSRAEGLPWGVAETGSFLVAGDRGDRRAAWLHATNAYLRQRGALWVAYFDLDWPTGDYRLLDAPSKRAWRDFC
ncbi:DUF7594 domain-containing protein [Spirillospora albida]|uniref:CBM96 family carbohydrate-binding protein n=1 Tax=Spirillospora albida TaxID=58123 RepID=UPI0004C0A4A8|nr:DNRLRE domain-containing protein [Spirillospora albida]